MQKSTVMRIGGLSLILASVLFIVWVILFNALIPGDLINSDFAAVIRNKSWLLVSGVVFPAVIFALFGIIAVYAKLIDKAGVIGLLAFILVLLTFILQASQLTWEICLYPVMANYQPAVPLFNDKMILKSSMVFVFMISFLFSALVGNVLFGIVICRSKIFQFWSGILLILGAVMYSCGRLIWRPFGSIGLIIYALALLYLGWQVWRAKA